MAEITLESLAKRIETLEQEVAEQRSRTIRKKDWRSSVGMFDNDPEFMQQGIAEALGNSRGRAYRRA